MHRWNSLPQPVTSASPISSSGHLHIISVQGTIPKSHSGLGIVLKELRFRMVGNAKLQKTACKSLTSGHCHCWDCFSTAVLPVLFKEELKNVESEEGGTAILHCEISKPDAPVEWRKGGVVIQPSAKYEMKLKGCTAELIIHGVELDDCGDYTCSTGYEITTGSVYVQGKMKAGRSALVLLPEHFTPQSLAVTSQTCLRYKPMEFSSFCSWFKWQYTHLFSSWDLINAYKFPQLRAVTALCTKGDGGAA